MLSDYGNKPIRENRDDDPFSQTLWRYNSGGRLLSQEGRSRAMRGGAGNQLDNPASEKVVHNRLTQLNGIRWQYDAHGRTIEKDNAQVRWRYRCDGEYRLSEVLTGPRDRNKPRLRVSFRYDPPVPGSVDVYDWPGHFVDHGHGESYARIRQEVWQAGHHSVSGSGTATGIAPGFTFSIIIAPHFSDDGEYLLTSATYDFAENAYASGGTGDSRHNIHFTVLPSSVTYRTPPETPWPKTRGPQTAKVVGPKVSRSGPTATAG